ncbi:retinitis pigmentosa 1-like 1 protein [Brachyistius frenatus]|uniref:retinitis pigmentosa 1-like 1 protein n=1 Tax=Brachyistius frenatus TaxID=100188 RepID=UPI0037E76342
MSNTPVLDAPVQGLSTGSGQTLPSRPPQTISDPSASKRVCFYKSGDYKFTGHRMVINARTFKTFDGLLDALSKKVPLPFGVRTITTPRGTHLVKALDDLHDGGNYVCSDQKKVKPLNMEEVNRRQVPWNTTRPFSAGRRRHQGVRFGHFSRRNEVANRPARVTERVAVRTPRRLVVIKNREPTVKRTIVLQRRTAPTFDALLDYLSQIMAFPVLKLYSTDGRRVDGLATLILCSGVVVAAGNEPFRLGSHSFHGTGQMAQAMFVDTVEPSVLQLGALCQNKSLSSGRGSRNFSLSSERYIVNQINKSQNESTNSCLNHHNASFDHHHTSAETCGNGRVDNGHHSCVVPQDDDIEKSFRVNQDGTMTVEMKVRLTIKEEEMLHWTTTLSRSSLNLTKRTVHASISGSANSSPDSNNAVAKDSSRMSEDETKEKNYPAGDEKAVGFDDERIHEGYTSTTSGKTKSLKRTPTPGPRHVNKKVSVESVTMVTELGVQESTLGHYSYMERAAHGETTEGYCVVKHSSSSSSNKPIPKPRKTVSAGASKKRINSSMRSSGVAEVLQIQNNGMEITETVMHIYESQGCYDNYVANTDCSADSGPLHSSTPLPESQPSIESGPLSSSNDCDIDCSWQPPTADLLQRQKEEMLSLSSEPLSPAYDITNNLPAHTENGIETATNPEIQKELEKNNTAKSVMKKKVFRPARSKRRNSKPKAMMENRLMPPKNTSELRESVSMPSLNPSPSEIHQYVENWLEKVSPDPVPYVVEGDTDGAEPRSKVVFLIGGDSESDEKTESNTNLDEYYASTSDAVNKYTSCLSVPLFPEGPALLNTEMKIRGLCVSMPNVRRDAEQQENMLRQHKSAEVIGSVDDGEASSSILNPKAKIKPVLRKICSSIQNIRRASDINTTSNLEKSTSLPDFQTQVASVFGSSCKAFLSFLSVMTLRDSLKDEVGEASQSRTTSEAMLMIESLQKISVIDDEEEQKASLSDLQDKATSQFRARWKDFQILRERLESEPLSPKFSETEFALDVVSEGGTDVFEEQQLGINDLMEELNMPQDLRAEITSTFQQVKSFYPLEESTIVETEKNQSDSEEDVEQFLNQCRDETEQSAELDEIQSLYTQQAKTMTKSDQENVDTKQIDPGSVEEYIEKEEERAVDEEEWRARLGEKEVAEESEEGLLDEEAREYDSVEETDEREGAEETEYEEDIKDEVEQEADEEEHSEEGETEETQVEDISKEKRGEEEVDENTEETDEKEEVETIHEEVEEEDKDEESDSFNADVEDEAEEDTDVQKEEKDIREVIEESYEEEEVENISEEEEEETGAVTEETEKEEEKDVEGNENEKEKEQIMEEEEEDEESDSFNADVEDEAEEDTDVQKEEKDIREVIEESYEEEEVENISEEEEEETGAVTEETEKEEEKDVEGNENEKEKEQIMEEEEEDEESDSFNADVEDEAEEDTDVQKEEKDMWEVIEESYEEEEVVHISEEEEEETSVVTEETEKEEEKDVEGNENEKEKEQIMEEEEEDEESDSFNADVEDEAEEDTDVQKEEKDMWEVIEESYEEEEVENISEEEEETGAVTEETEKEEEKDVEGNENEKEKEQIMEEEEEDEESDSFNADVEDEAEEDTDVQKEEKDIREVIEESYEEEEVENISEEEEETGAVTEETEKEEEQDVEGNEKEIEQIMEEEEEDEESDSFNADVEEEAEEDTDVQKEEKDIREVIEESYEEEEVENISEEEEETDAVTEETEKEEEKDVVGNENEKEKRQIMKEEEEDEESDRFNTDVEEETEEDTDMQKEEKDMWEVIEESYEEEEVENISEEEEETGAITEETEKEEEKDVEGNEKEKEQIMEEEEEDGEDVDEEESDKYIEEEEQSDTDCKNVLEMVSSEEQKTESPTKSSPENQCEDDNGKDTVNELESDEGAERCEKNSNSLFHPVEISQELLDFVNNALQSSSLTFTFDTRGNIRLEPENTRVLQSTAIPKRQDSSYGFKCLPSPSTSELSDYRPETSESGGYKTQDSLDILSESGEEASWKPSPAYTRSARRTERTHVKQVNSKLFICSNSENLQGTKLKSAGSFSSNDSGSKASKEDLSYFSAASSLKAEAEATTHPVQRISFSSEKGLSDGVLIEKGRWLLKENHLIRKSPPVSLGMYNNLDSTSVDTDQENTSEDSPHYLTNPLAAISSSELEELAKPPTPKCNYFNMPHGSDSDPFLDNASVKSVRKDLCRGGIRVSPIDTSKTWSNKNGSTSSFASVEFKIPDRKVHPEGESSAMAQSRRTSTGGGSALQAQDSLDTLQVRCGQYCPIL